MALIPLFGRRACYVGRRASFSSIGLEDLLKGLKDNALCAWRGGQQVESAEPHVHCA